MRIDVRGPSNEREPEDLEHLMGLIANGGSTYWRRQACMASLSCTEGPLVGATLGIVVESGIGVLLLYTTPSGEDEYCLTNPAQAGSDETVTIYPGGNEWDVPRRYFVEIEAVRPVLERFLLSGERADGDWVVLGTE